MAPNPAIPRLAVRCALFDIEGTVADVRFVYDVMFPFVRKHVGTFLESHASDPVVQSAVQQLLAEAAALPPSASAATSPPQTTSAHPVVQAVDRLMDVDSKTTGLKALQGLIWKEGFQAGLLEAELFPDVVPALRAWRAAGIDLRIYSSGSILAQKLFFQHTSQGDLAPWFSAHYDTTIGGKRVAESYRRIAEDCQMPPEQIIFFSDVTEELVAAAEAGMLTAACARPNNAPLAPHCPGPIIASFDAIELIPL